MIWIAIIFYSLIILSGIMLIFGISKNDLKPAKKAHPLSVIIPFKNEANRIMSLIQSLNKADLPENIEFIFIDDHSEDSTITLLLDELDVRFKIHKLKHESGKKQAIRQGVKLAKHDLILTLDADINFSPDYLQQVAVLPHADLMILPVKMEPSNLYMELYCIEFQWLQTLTFGLAGLGQPVLCNGANLRFSRAAFNKAESIRQDYTIPSGDDVFLLRAIQVSKGTISACPQQSLKVGTRAPENIIDLLNQRLRWILKMKTTGTLFGIGLIIISNLLFVYALIALITDVFWLLPIGLKWFGEWIGTRRFFSSVGSDGLRASILLPDIWYCPLTLYTIP